MQRYDRLHLVSTARSLYAASGNPNFQEPNASGIQLMQAATEQALPGRRGKYLTVTTSPRSARSKELLAHCLDADAWDAGDAAERFVRRSVGDLLEYGFCLYEVEGFHRPKGKKVKLLRLRRIQPWTVRRASGGWNQSIPQTDLTHRVGRALGAATDTGPVFLPDDSVVVLRITRGLFKRFRSALNRVSQVPDAPLPEWAVANLDQLRLIAFDEQRKRREEALATATRNIGWQPLARLEQKETDYYYLIRQIRWLGFLRSLRSCVLAELNAALPRVLAPINVTARVSEAGLPSQADLDDLESRLTAGSVSLEEAYPKVTRWLYDQ